MNKVNISTARFASSMSAHPILAVQNILRFSNRNFCWRPRVQVFTDSKGSWAGFRTLWGSLFDMYWECWVSERKDLLVREERRSVASGLPVVWQGTPGSYAIGDKCWTHLSMKRSLKIDTLGHGQNSRLIEAVCTYQGNEVLSTRLLTSILDLLT